MPVGVGLIQALHVTGIDDNLLSSHQTTEPNDASSTANPYETWAHHAPQKYRRLRDLSRPWSAVIVNPRLGKGRPPPSGTMSLVEKSGLAGRYGRKASPGPPRASGRRQGRFHPIIENGHQRAFSAVVGACLRQCGGSLGECWPWVSARCVGVGVGVGVGARADIWAS